MNKLNKLKINWNLSMFQNQISIKSKDSYKQILIKISNLLNYLSKYNNV